MRFFTETEKIQTRKVITKLTENYLKYYLVSLDYVLNTGHPENNPNYFYEN